jgi:hypothetical protein
MHVYIHELADHAVSVTHPAAFTDGSVSLRFMLEDAKDNLGLNFADLDDKPKSKFQVSSFKFHVPSSLNQGVTRQCQHIQKVKEATVTTR